MTSPVNFLGRKSPATAVQTNRVLILLVFSTWMALIATINVLGVRDFVHSAFSGARPELNLQKQQQADRYVPMSESGDAERKQIFVPTLPIAKNGGSQTTLHHKVPMESHPTVAIESRYGINQERIKPVCDGVNVQRTGQRIPVVFTILNREIPIIRKTLPFICETNRVVVLTNVKLDDSVKSTCAEIIDVSGMYEAAQNELYWPITAPSNEKVFFTRWYLLRNWLALSGTDQFFAIDSDVLLYQNITDMVQNHAETFCRTPIWLIFEPPRVTQPYFLGTLNGLRDITEFWNKLLLPSIWTQEFIDRRSPTDVIAMGHYCHLAVGKPYPCWGFGADQLPGTCDNTMEYAHTVVLDRLQAQGITVKYKPETLTVYADGSAPGNIPTVADHDFWTDGIRVYNLSSSTGTRQPHKQLRYHKGVPQLQRRTGAWADVYGLILEDALEDCVDVHMRLARHKASCFCVELCCDVCV